MHFRLYKMSNGYELIKKDKKETIIFNELSKRMIENPNERFMIIRNINKGDETFKGIRSQEDYDEYAVEYERRRLSQLSCMELKKEMMDIVYDKPEDKVKRK